MIVALVPSSVALLTLAQASAAKKLIPATEKNRFMTKTSSIGKFLSATTHVELALDGKHPTQRSRSGLL
jgi:hypothetical protein